MEAATAAYEELRLHDAMEAILAIANRGNLYMEQVAPWTSFKKVILRESFLTSMQRRT
jgi:methionyl-tRNA synthetase